MEKTDRKGGGHGSSTNTEQWLRVPRGMPSVYTNTSKLKPVERKQPTLWESGTDRDNIREGVSAQEVASSNLPPDPNNQGLPQSITGVLAKFTLRHSSAKTSLRNHMGRKDKAIYMVSYCAQQPSEWLDGSRD